MLFAFAACVEKRFEMLLLAPLALALFHSPFPAFLCRNVADLEDQARDFAARLLGQCASEKERESGLERTMGAGLLPCRVGMAVCAVVAAVASILVACVR